MEPAKRNLSGKLYDPTFLFLIGAMVVAVASSVALRAVISGAGPAGARGAQVDGEREPVRTSVPAHRNSHQIQN